MRLFQQLIREDDGQDVVEYGLLIGTISLLVIVGTTSFSGQISTWFGALTAKLVVHVGP